MIMTSQETDQGTNQGMLTLTAPKTIEESLVDFFLDSDHHYGFTSIPVRGHTSDHSGMSMIEQVTGRQEQVQFQILVDEAQAREICLRLEVMFSGAGIHFWFLTASLEGRI